MNTNAEGHNYDRQEVSLAYYSLRIDLASRAQRLTPKEVIGVQHAGSSEDAKRMRTKKYQHYVMGKRRLFDTRLVISHRVISDTDEERVWQENISLRCPHSAVIIVEAGDRDGERYVRHVGLVKKK